MNKRLVDIVEEQKEQEFLAKVAEVDRVWGEDEQALSILSSAIEEIEKEASAGRFGEGGLTNSEILSLGVQLTVDALEELEKEAAAEEEVDQEDDIQEKLAEDYTIGLIIGEVLRNDVGITQEDIEKIASEEEAEEFGQFCAYILEQIADAQ